MASMTSHGSSLLVVQEATYGVDNRGSGTKRAYDLLSVSGGSTTTRRIGVCRVCERGR